MAKARIIIADTDENYMMSFQLKFIERFFEKIDLEIITDEAYFNEMFAVPQRADILILSENLYNLSIQKHDIKNVFLMTEHYEIEQTADLKVNRIFKYTSIKEIFSEILGKSSEILNIDNNLKKKSQVIVVSSSSGGVGKTTVAMGVSGCLTKSYKKVLYINTEQLQSFQCLLQNQAPITGTEIYNGLIRAEDNAYEDVKHMIRNELFNYLPPFKASLISFGIKQEIFMKIAMGAKGSEDYDFIIVDTDSTFNEFKAKLLDMADRVIFVTKQNNTSVLSTNMLVANINGMNAEKYFFVCNDFDKEADNALITPEITLKFRINEYIEHFDHYDQFKCIDFASQTSFEKAAYLLI